MPCKRHTAAALSILCYSSHAARSFLSFQSFRVHFLTFIDNYPISQRASSHACSLSWRAVTVSVSVVSIGLRGQSYNLVT